MAPTSENLWRELQRGDRVRLVHFPCEFSDREYTMHDDTRAAYRHLIATKEVLTVNYLDEDGYPWVEFEIANADGEIDYYSLMLNHDGIQQVDESIELNNEIAP